MANVLVVAPTKGIGTIGEFVAAARTQRSPLNYVTIVVGSAAHLNSERFRIAAKFEAQPVFYKGSPEGLTDVMTGRVDFYFCPLLPALPLIRDGKLIALAVSSLERSPDFQLHADARGEWTTARVVLDLGHQSQVAEDQSAFTAE